MALLELSHVSHAYDETLVLDDVNLRLSAGEALAVTSPSGSGKTTLLSIAGLLLNPTSGSVLVGGCDAATLDDAGRSAMRRKTFGFLFQHTQLIGSLRALDNVMVPARFAHLSASEMARLRNRAQELLESFGLADRMYHYPFQLSGGQKRRVMAARALIMEPRILIADEPTNDMDSDSAQGVTAALFRHVEQGGALLIATHDSTLAARADRTFGL